MCRLYGIECPCRVLSPGLVHDNAAATHLYYVAQEALTNAVRRGRAKHVDIWLAVVNHKGTLTISNDGKPFPRGAMRRGGIGLSIMQSRAEMIGGALKVQARKGGGTVATCTFDNRPIQDLTSSRTSFPSGRGSRGSRRG